MTDLGRNLFYALLAELFVVIVAVLVKDDKRKLAMVLGVGTLIAALLGFGPQISAMIGRFPSTPSYSNAPQQTLTSTAATSQEEANIRIAMLDGGGELVITDIRGNTIAQMPTSITEPVVVSWSPNGGYLLATTRSGNQGATYLINVDTGEVRRWAEPMGTLDFKWSPTSDRLSLNLYSDSGHQLDIASTYGTERRTLYQGWTVNNTPEWSPNGGFLVLAGSPDESTLRHLYSINADTGEIQDITPPMVDDAGFGGGWLDDSRLIFAANMYGEWSEQIVDLSTGDMSPLLNDPPDGQVEYPLLSPSETKVILSVRESDDSWSLHIQNLQTGANEQIWHSEQAIGLYPSSWSPLEDSVVFLVQTDSQGVNNQTLAIDLYANREFLLPGQAYGLLQRPDIYSASRDWISEDQLVVVQVLGQDSARFLLVDSTGNELAELCSISVTLGQSCAIWAP